MSKLADFIIRRRWLIIGVVVGLTIVLGWQATKVGLNADFSTYLRQDDPLVQQYNRIGDIFGGNSIGVALLSAKDAFTPENLNLLKKLTDAYKNVDGVAYVTSLTNVIDFRKTEWGLDVGKLLNRGQIPRTAKELAALRTYVMHKDRYSGQLVSKDGTTAAILLRFTGGGRKVVSQFATSMRVKAATEKVLAQTDLPAGTKIYFGGMPFLIFNMTLLITENLIILVPLMIIILVLVLYFGFRHWAGVVFPMLVVTVSVIWIIGFMGIWGLKMDLLTGIAPVILLALGSADGIHLLKRYFERRRNGESADEATRKVFKEMGTPIILTTITTTVGFASLAVSDFSVIQQFGLLTALGVLVALLITLTMLPALLSFGVTPKPLKPGKVQSHRFGERSGLIIYRHKFAILIGAVAVIAVSVFALPRIVKDVDWTLCLQKGSGPFHAEMLLREKFGGSLPIQILVDGDLKDPATLKIMREIEQRLEGVPYVSKSQSIASIIAEMNDVMNDRYIVPESRQGVTNLWFLIDGQEMMEQLVSKKETEALLQAKLDTWHTTALVAAVDSINRILAAFPQQIAVVNLNQTPPEAQGRLLEIRRQRILTGLRMDLQKYGIQLANEDLQQAVDRALQAGIKGPARLILRDAVSGYLHSPEAEVELPGRAVNRLSLEISQKMAENPTLDSEAITRMILQSSPNVNHEDAKLLAESLAEITHIKLGELQLAPVLRGLQEALPANFAQNENLWKDIKGTLWQANETSIVLDAKIAEQILSKDKNIPVRELSINIKQSGLAPVLNRMEEELTPTQVESLSITLLLVIILLSFIFRSFLGGVLAVIPISLTILLNFAVMGYLGIGLDSFTAMIASVAIGLGIDTDIHFISRLREELKKDGKELAALQRTLNTTGVSIIINALAVGLGFLVLLAAGGQHIRRFGGLTAMTILVSALFTLTILPSLLFWIKPRFLGRLITSGVEARSSKSRESGLQLATD